MRRPSLAAALASGALALLLAASPVVAAAPASPATGTWSAIGKSLAPAFIVGGLTYVWGSKVGPDGKLYAYGGFLNAGGDETADFLAVYDPATGAWTGLGSDGAGNGALNGVVYSIAWYNGVLYAAGAFSGAGGVTGADHVAAWNGTSWTRRGGSGAFNGTVYSLSVGAGVLFAGGTFTNAGGAAAADYAAWFDGYAWHGLAANDSDPGVLTGQVVSTQALADGRLYVAGSFLNAGPSGKFDLVCWYDPASESWNPVGGSAAPDGAFTAGGLYSVLVVGSRVYVGGDFVNAGGNAKADRVAMWNGTAWTNLGSDPSGTNGALDTAVFSLTAYGSNVIATGSYANSALAGTKYVSVWNGSKWMKLNGQALDGTAFGASVSGRTLYLAGGFNQTVAPAVVANTGGVAAYGLPGVASAPRSLAATAGTKRVALKWAAPATTNGSGAIRDYVVQYRKSGTTTWKTFADGVKSTTGAVVTGLASGTGYQFRVAAKTDWGIGASSAIVLRKAK